MEFKIDTELCVASLACVRVCPADAVAVEADTIRIVDESCTRCGICLPACPHDAILALGDLARATELALGGKAALILSVEAAAYFYPATPEQVVNACYAAGFRMVHRGVIGDELVAQEYLKLWGDEEWGTMIRSTCPVIVETVRKEYPELIPYLAPVQTPVAAEARYLKAMYGRSLPVAYAGVCLTEGGPDVDAAITFEELDTLLDKRRVRVSDQPNYFTRIPEERRRHWSTAGGLPLELLTEERQSSRRFRKVRGLGALKPIARAVVERIDLGFVDILPCEGCLDHPLLGPKDELFRRREIVHATEPPRAAAPVVEPEVARRVTVGAVFEVRRNGHAPAPEAVDEVLAAIGLAPNGRPWDCGACGYDTCRAFAEAAVQGRTTLRSCPPYLNRQTEEAQQQAAVDALTGLATYRVLRDRLGNEVARSKRSGEMFGMLFVDLDNFKQVNDRFGHEAGNEVLKSAAQELGVVVRSTDFAARYGGDEFVVLLVRTGVEGAVGVAEKVRARVEAMGRRLNYPDGLVTASVGVAAFDPAVPEQEDVLVVADRALYRAKAGGRNRVATGDN
ncbi:MAG TPA: diguanylate cyclase [Gemmatimonadales bacterium]|nr:diguanylate cyclase [Gemmatimonadales bacterium]